MAVHPGTSTPGSSSPATAPIELADPATGRPAFTVVDDGEQAAAEALGRARAAAAAWAATPLLRRGAILARAALGVRADSRLLDLVVADVGKPVTEARGEIERTARILEYYGSLAAAPVGELYEDAAGAAIRVVRVPLGTVLLVTPWNFPAAIPAWKLAPALLMGNAVCLKPSPAASRVAARLVACLHDAGVPEDVLAQVDGDAGPVTAMLAAAPDAVSFTGSTRVGGLIAAQAAPTRVRLQLEMGGSNAVYVSEAADPAVAARVVAAGAFGYAGQKCTATGRVFVHHRRAEQLARELRDVVGSLANGAPADDATVVGPLITQAARERAEQAVDDAVARGANLLARGERPAGGGWFHEPVVLDSLGATDPLWTEELFAPVVALAPVSGLEEGMARVDEGDYGLVAGIVSPLAEEIATFARGVHAGLIRVNAATTGLEPHVPFGGSRGSSFGPREQGRAALDFFSETRTIYG